MAVIGVDHQRARSEDLARGADRVEIGVMAEDGLDRGGSEALGPCAVEVCARRVDPVAEAGTEVRWAPPASAWTGTP
ncbi:hypothetical protein [Rhodovulum viride]|uniref:hypothetical protein n=1 Tax=Rhodovulum viride TaxID=1231134 RepID=UPI001FECA485|nr:hypothetical protein [Rhodovulum viride]